MQLRRRRVNEATAARPCAHSRHVGTCSHCQRAQLARWESQLSECAASQPPRAPVASRPSGS